MGLVIDRLGVVGLGWNTVGKDGWGFDGFARRGRLGGKDVERRRDENGCRGVSRLCGFGLIGTSTKGVYEASVVRRSKVRLNEDGCRWWSSGVSDSAGCFGREKGIVSWNILHSVFSARWSTAQPRICMSSAEQLAAAVEVVVSDAVQWGLAPHVPGIKVLVCIVLLAIVFSASARDNLGKSRGLRLPRRSAYPDVISFPPLPLLFLFLEKLSSHWIRCSSFQQQRPPDIHAASHIPTHDLERRLCSKGFSFSDFWPLTYVFTYRRDIAFCVYSPRPRRTSPTVLFGSRRRDGEDDLSNHYYLVIDDQGHQIRFNNHVTTFGSPGYFGEPASTALQPGHSVWDAVSLLDFAIKAHRSLVCAGAIASVLPSHLQQTSSVGCTISLPSSMFQWHPDQHHHLAFYPLHNRYQGRPPRPYPSWQRAAHK